MYAHMCTFLNEYSYKSNIYRHMYTYVCVTPYSCIYIFTDTQRAPQIPPTEASFLWLSRTWSRLYQSQHQPRFPGAPQGAQPPAPHTFICCVLDPWLRQCSKNSWAVLLQGLRKPKHRAASTAALFDDLFISIRNTGTNFSSSPT